MSLSIKGIVLGTMLAALVGATSVNAEAVKTVTVSHFGHPHAVVVHPYHHRYHHHHWRHHRHYHHDHWRHHHHYHHR